MRTFAALVLAALVAGCETRPAVDYAVIRSAGADSLSVAEQIKASLMSHGFSQSGISQPKQPGGAWAVLSYDGPDSTYASVSVFKGGCVEFTTLIEINDGNRALAKKAFADTMQRLNADKSLRSEDGECRIQPNKSSKAPANKERRN